MENEIEEEECAIYVIAAGGNDKRRGETDPEKPEKSDNDDVTAGAMQKSVDLHYKKEEA